MSFALQYRQSDLEDIDSMLDSRRDETSRESGKAVKRYEAPPRRTSPNRELREQFRGAQRRRTEAGVANEKQPRAVDITSQSWKRRGHAPEPKKSHYTSDDSTGAAKDEKRSRISRVFDWL
jgi:hypothetical protein